MGEHERLMWHIRSVAVQSYRLKDFPPRYTCIFLKVGRWIWSKLEKPWTSSNKEMKQNKTYSYVFYVRLFYLLLWLLLDKCLAGVCEIYFSTQVKQTTKVVDGVSQFRALRSLSFTLCLTRTECLNSLDLNGSNCYLVCWRLPTSSQNTGFFFFDHTSTKDIKKR